MRIGMKQYLTRNRRRRAWKKVVRAMACVVVFCTVYALILPAITMERELICPLDEHTHTDGCYTQVTTEEQSILSCSQTEHVHTELCYSRNETPDSTESEAPADGTEGEELAGEPADLEAVGTVGKGELSEESLFKEDQGITLMAELPYMYVVKPTPIEGTNVTWALTKDDSGAYTLRFDGEGKIPDYTANTMKPWQDYKSTTLKVAFGEGVTEVGEYALSGYVVTDIEWGGIETIAVRAFEYLRGGPAVLTIPGTVKTIEDFAFVYSYSIMDVQLAEGVEFVGNSAFGIQSAARVPIHIPASVETIGPNAFWIADEYIVSEDNACFCADDGVLYSKDMTVLVDYPRYKAAQEYRVPESVILIRDSALCNVRFVPKLYIPQTVETVEVRLVQNSNYEEIFFEDGFVLNGTGLWMYQAYNLRTIRLPENTPANFGGLFYQGTVNPNLETFKIPNGTTNLTAMGNNSTYFPSLREVTYDAKDSKIGTTNYIFGASSYFDLIVGLSVDKLPANFRYISEKSTAIRFQGENTFAVEAGAFSGTGSPLESISGSFYVDSQGVLYSYDAQSGTAKVVYVSPGREAVTIPASITPDDGIEYRVTAVGTDALLHADDLKTITFESPQTILHMESFALANCPTLTSVNGMSTAEEAQAIFSNEAVEIGHSIYYNTGLNGSGGSQDMDGQEKLIVTREAASEMTVNLRSSGKTMEWVQGENGTGSYQLLTGDTVTATASVGNTEGNEDYVYRVYFRMTSAEGILDVKPGTTYVFDGQSTTCYATEEPYTYYMEFAPSVGSTINIPVTATYPSPNSSGGGLNIWGEILTSQEAQDHVGDVVQNDTGLKLQWVTRPDTFKLSKSTNVTSYSIVSNGKGGGKPNQTLSWTIKLERDEETVSPYGKDYAVAVVFTDILALPEGMSWDEDVVKAIKEGRALRNGNNISINGVEVISWSVQNNNPTLRGANLYWDETLQNVVFTLELIKKESEAEMNASNVTLNIVASNFVIDMEKMSPGEQYPIWNNVTASVEYCYGENRELTASALKVISGGAAKLQLKKTTSGVKYFGEDVTYTIDFFNNGAIPFVATEPGSYEIRDSLSEYSYIKPENMERMFADHPDLVIQIEKALLSEWEQVTGVDGTPAWKNIGNSDLGTYDEHKLSIVRTENGRYRVTVDNTDGDEFDTVAQALIDAGYAVTRQAKYTCVWKLNDADIKFQMDTVRHQEFLVYATIKDSFQRISEDWPREYPASEATTVTNTARIYGPKNNIIASASVSDKVKREAYIHKNVYTADSVQYDGSNITDGDVLTYRLDFYHYGRGSYENLPMVDDIYGSQNLLVPVAENPGLQSRGLAIHNDGGVDYYILTEGTYYNVIVGVDDEGNSMNAASIRVQEAESEVQIDLGGQQYEYTGLHTKIKWYFPKKIGAEYLLQTKYKTLVNLKNSGPTYTIGNVVWMNDRSETRIYDPVWSGGTILEFEKHIVTERGATHEADILEKHSRIECGDTVLYRLTLHNTNDFPFLLTGANLADRLPNNYGIFQWEKGVNVSFAGYETEGYGIEVSGLDDWSIADSYRGLSGDNHQYIVWPEEALIQFTQQSTIYLYFTITYPDNGEEDFWSQYESAARGLSLDNTLYVYLYPSSVTHDLKEPGHVLLQKGVYGMYHFGNGASTYMKSGNSRVFYNNRDIKQRSVLYYVTVYNGGGKRLYLDRIYDQLPEGFTYKQLLVTNSAFESTYPGTITNQIFTNGGTSLGNNPLVTFGIGGVTYRSASIRANLDDSGVSFEVSGGTGNYAVKYDGEREKYYLDCGEAIVFGYLCEIGLAEETPDSATNTIAMAYDDYLDTGLEIITKRDLPIKATDSDIFHDYNDGTRSSASGTDGKVWLVSDVTLVRGGIIPGVTKYTDSFVSENNPTVTKYTNGVNPTDTVNWRIRLHNAGTLSLVDYTFTDIMPAPYVFEGTVTFKYYDAQGNLMGEQTIVTIPKRQKDDTSLVATTGSGTTVTVPLDGTWINIDKKGSDDLHLSIEPDENGNEVLSIDCGASNMAIAEGGYVDVFLSSRNPTPVHVNAVYTNRAMLHPNVQRFDGVGHGSMLWDESGNPVGVENYSPVNVSFGYATSSEKRVAEDSRPDNTAVSTDPISNRIALQRENSSFTYTLTVSNDTEYAMTELILIDNLPQPGDHTPFDNSAARNSGFTVNLAEDPAFTVTVTPMEGDPFVLTSEQYSLEYSTATDFGGPQSQDWKGEPTGKWSLVPTNARSFRLIIRDPSGTLILPESSVSVTFKAVVGADAEPGMIAWNSFGYHYNLLNVTSELEAMPLVVGVSIPGVPILDKQLVNKDLAPAPAEEAVSFGFLLYAGDALPGDYNSEAALVAALEEADRAYKKVELTVPEGSSHSQQYKLKFEEWTWLAGQKYTVVELPTSDEYDLLRFEGSSSESYTFLYDPSYNQSIHCVNMLLSWSTEITKINDSGEALSGAVFGLYSPVQTEQLSSVPAEYASLEIPMTLEQEGRTWYLTALAESDAAGGLRFDDLLQESYFLKEVKAPDGYMLPSETWELTRQGSTDGVYSQTVVNYAAYELPETGGIGTTLFYIFGGFMAVAAVVLPVTGKRLIAE